MTNVSAIEAAFDLSLARPDTLGAVVRDGGVNFALFSDHATAVELCLFDDDGRTEIARRELPEAEGGIWYGFLPGVGPGQVYGYRVHGPYEPEQGHRFNPSKLLLDPYARQLRGGIEWDDALFGYTIGEDDLSFDDRDSAPFMPKGVVVDSTFDWDGRRPAAPPLEGHRDLRGPRQGPDHAPSRRRAGRPRHLCRARRRPGDRPPASGSASPRSNCCRSTPLPTTAT